MQGRSRRTTRFVAVLALGAAIAAPGAGYAATATPAAPTGLSAGTNPIVTLTWQDPAIDESGFSIESCAGPGCTNFAVIGSTAANVVTFQDSFYAPGTTNRYRIRSWNDRGYSAYSNVTETLLFASAVLPTATATAGATSGVAPSTITFDGSQSTPTNGVIQSYTWSFGDGTTATGPVVTHTFTSWATYGVTLKIRDLFAADTATIEVTIAAPPLTAPTNLRATSTTRRNVSLTWTNPVSDATSITVQRRAGARCTNFAATQNVGGSAASLTETGLRSGTTYRYRLVVTNSVGATATSAIATVKVR